MYLALNVAKMAKEGFSRTAIGETHQLTQKPCAIVREEKQVVVEFSGHRMVKAAIERHPAMICENQTDSCLPCQNSTAKHPQSRWRLKGMGSPPLRIAPPRPKMPPPSPGHGERNQRTDIQSVPPGYVYIHTTLSNAQLFKHDAYAQDHKRAKDFIPDLLTDHRPSTS